MQTIDYRATQDRLADTTSSVGLAISVLFDRIPLMPKATRHLLFDMVRALSDMDDAEELASMRRAFIEIIENAPIKVVPVPVTESRPLAKKNQEWADHIGRTIRTLRKAAGLNQSELAEKSGLQQSHVSRIENAEHTANNLTLEKIARALGVPVGVIDPNSA